MKSKYQKFDGNLNNFGKKYETSKNHLSENAAVVQSPEFERAIVVSCRDEKLTFSQEEIIKKYHFCSEEEEPMECSSSDDFATQVLSQGTTSAKTPVLTWVPPTSNLVERFFSQAKYFLSDYRKAISPQNLESQLFLHFNKEFWGPRTIQRIIVEKRLMKTLNDI